MSFQLREECFPLLFHRVCVDLLSVGRVSFRSYRWMNSHVSFSPLCRWFGLRYYSDSLFYLEASTAAGNVLSSSSQPSRLTFRPTVAIETLFSPLPPGRLRPVGMGRGLFYFTDTEFMPLGGAINSSRVSLWAPFNSSNGDLGSSRAFAVVIMAAVLA